MHHFFYAINSFVNRSKFLSAVIAVAFIGLLFFFASRISFEENITQLIPGSEQSNTTSKVLDQVNFVDKISIMVSAEKNGSPDDLANYASEFLDSLDIHCKPYIEKVQGKFDEGNIQETFDFVYNNLPLFLDESDYGIIQERTVRDSIAAIVERDYKSLVSPTGIVSRDFILKDPLGITFIALKKLQQLSVGDEFTLHNGFILTKGKDKLLLFITPKLAANETDQNTIFIQNLDRIQDRLNQKYKGKVNMTFFGTTPVAVANATQIKADVRNTSIFAAISLILLLAYFYKSVTTPFIIFIPSIIGSLFALAVLFFIKGTISIIALGISSILLGETTDYSIYVLTHLRNNKNVKLLYRDISKPLILCGITTAVTFLCLFFIKSEALKDLGIFAALSVVSTSVFSLILIPFLYKIKKGEINVPQANAIDSLGNYPYHKNKFLVIGVVILLIASLFTYDKVTFNNDLAALNYVPSELKKAELELENLGNISSKSILLATHGNSYEEVITGNAALFTKLKNMRQENNVLSYSSIGGIVHSDKEQSARIDRWNTFWNPNMKSAVKQHLISSGNTFGFKESSFAGFYNTLEKPFRIISIADYTKIKSFFLDEFIAVKNGFYTITTVVKVPNGKRDAFVKDIKSQPNLVIIDRQQTNETFLGNLKTNFKDLVDYSFIAIILILILAFRRIELVIVSIIPILFSWIFTTGIMGIFGMQFNIINIIVCTLIFGIGVDYSIFMTSALQKEHTFGKTELPTYRSSILLSVATTILGIGVLIFAKHPALNSIALIAIVGIMSTLLITFVIQPLVFNFIVTNRVKKGKPPYEIRRFLHSSLSFIYYGLGGFLLSIFSVTLMKLLPISKKAKMKAFHYMMSKFMQSVLVSYPSLRRKIINTGNERFDKPAIIIANHTSFLDILAVGMLSPKIIFLVSDWVYNSPIFGKGVRLAGFYPVSAGINNGIEHLREKVNQGFSLMVFPEGTRSEDNLIKRFHKGAFYLADQLQLDIVPVVIHGYAEVLPKGDFIINGGQTIVEILPRISPTDKSFGDDYTDRAKSLSSFFKSHHKKMRYNSEGPSYFNKMIMNSFAYKEYVIVDTVRKDLKENAELYLELSNHIPAKASILHFGNDYGQVDFLLAVREPQRKLTSFIWDEEKASVARTNHIVKKRRIEFISDAKNITDRKHDVLLLTSGQFESCLVNVLNTVGTIIIVNNPEYKESIINAGFAKSYDDAGLIILKKKHEGAL